MTRSLDDEPHALNLRMHRRADEVGTFFVTKCLRPRKNILLQDNYRCIADEIINYVRFSVENDRIYLGAFIVMPDHWHGLFAGCQEVTLPEIMKSMGTWIGRKSRTKLDEHGIDWQDGYYDTRIRSGNQFRHICNYIEQNPVRGKFIERKGDWAWSSANSRHHSILMRPWPWDFEMDITNRF